MGKWKTTFEGRDENGNNIWDASEKEAITAADQSIATFKNDGTFTIIGSDTVIGKYSFSSDNKSLIITEDGINTDTSTIIQLDAASFILSNKAGTDPLDFTELAKIP